MNSEKEAEKMLTVVKCGLDIQFGCGDMVDIGDKEAAAEIIVEDLQKAGIGDKKQAAREALEEIRSLTRRKHYYITSRDIDEIFVKLYGEPIKETKAEEYRNKSKLYWMLTDEEVHKYEKITFTPYYTELNISEELKSAISKKMELACEQGKTRVTVDLFSVTSFQGRQIKDMMPYLRWYYMKDGFNFTMRDCVVTIDWTAKE